MKFNFGAELWLYPGDAGWVFVTLPKEIANDIKLITKELPRRGFGSVKVSVEVNDVDWKTSIFPDSQSGSYLLPVKKDVRKQASVSVSDSCDFVIQIIDL